MCAMCAVALNTLKLVSNFKQLNFTESDNQLLVKETRSTQGAQTSLAEDDHYSCIAHCIMCMKRCEAAKWQQCYNNKW